MIGAFIEKAFPFNFLLPCYQYSHTQGHVSSYYGMDFHKHTAFQVSPADIAEPEVRQILTIDSGVLSLS